MTPTTGPKPRRGRGRPPVFDEQQRVLYLKHVQEGVPLADAAAMAGITRQWAAQLARTDTVFRTARQTAIEAGRRVRWEGRPHDEYRYIHGGCRCTQCRTAAAQGRAERRTHAAGNGERTDSTTGADLTAPTVILMPTRDTRSDQPLHSLRAVS